MDIYDITASALTAQRLRLDTISSNLANANTTRKPDGSLGAYKRKAVVFSSMVEEASNQLMGANSGSGRIPRPDHTGGVSFGPDGKPRLTIEVEKGASDAVGVKVVEITENTAEPTRLIFDPSHPDANKDGYVEMPNVNVVTEMVDMISASRAYEANVTAFQSAKSMGQAALDI